MDIDPLLKNLILDFLVRQSLDPTLISVIRALDPPDDNFNLKKLFLLKKLESDTSRYPVSEETLELLVNLEEAEFQLGNERVSDSLKRAFCAVAVECTVKYLKSGDKFNFTEAVKSIWKGKIEGMKERENGGLRSEELWAWKEEIETAATEEAFVDIVVEKSGGVNGVECVNAYLREEREKMGPSILELLAERLKNGVTLQEILGVGVDLVPGKAGEKVDNGKGKLKLRENDVASGNPSNGDSNEKRANGASGNPNNGNSNERRANGASNEKRANGASGNPSNGDSNERRANGAPQVDKSGEARGSVPEAVKNNKRRRRTKDDKNARARERGESTDRSQEASGKNMKVRRATRKWSREEVEVFMTEVNEHGKRWQYILNHNRATFLYRTGVDLKDKWRNLMGSQAQPSAQQS